MIKVLGRANPELGLMIMNLIFLFDIILFHLLYFLRNKKKQKNMRLAKSLIYNQIRKNIRIKYKFIKVQVLIISFIKQQGLSYSLLN